MARQWQDGPPLSATKTLRAWRTRPDPFADIWASDVVPQLAADEYGRLQALTLFEWLCEQYPGRFQPGRCRRCSAGCATGARKTIRITRRTSSGRP
jgi:hypothetical protein